MHQFLFPAFPYFNDVQMMGASGRIFMSGTTEEMQKACEAIKKTLLKVKGRAR